jgi:hypothetical protein
MSRSFRAVREGAGRGFANAMTLSLPNRPTTEATKRAKHSQVTSTNMSRGRTNISAARGLM